jgi:DNA invertase Pin-like site-specific DNA recombinase
LREELHPLGIDLYLQQQGIDTTTPAGKALFQMMGVFAEFERAMIKERVKSGLEQAKAQGKVLGRPTIEAEKEAAIRADLVEGKARFDAPRGGVRRRRPRHGVATARV